MPSLTSKTRTALEKVDGASRDPDTSIAVAIPDNTRPLSYSEVLPPLLDWVQPADSVTVIVGNGLHRPMTDDEIAPIQRACRDASASLLQHDASADDQLVQVSADVSGGKTDWPELPAITNKVIRQADQVISVGTVEPHQYAGFSGGAKGVAIGCGGEPTISAMHGLAFLRHQGTRLGRIDRNPFQRAVWALTDWLDEPLGLQIVPPSSHTQVAVEAGPLRETFEAAVEIAADRFFEPFDRRVDWLTLEIPTEKANNFYQASRAATYAGLVDSPAISEGGTLLIRATCPEGIGQGAGEQACAEALARGLDALLEELHSDRRIQTKGGQQRAYVIAQTLERFDIGLVGADPQIPLLHEAGIPQFDSLTDARDALALGSNGRTVDDVFHNVPYYRG